MDKLAQRLLDLLDLISRMFEEHANRFPEPYFDRLKAETQRARRAIELAIQPSPPFYARVLSAEVECPSCHRLIKFKTLGKTLNGHWDKRSRLLTCACKEVYTPAVLLYRRRKGGQVHPVARDQVPTPEQRTAIQVGFRIVERTASRQPMERTNLVMEDQCTCGPGVWREGQDQRCPVHHREKG